MMVKSVYSSMSTAAYSRVSNRSSTSSNLIRTFTRTAVAPAASYSCRLLRMRSSGILPPSHSNACHPPITITIPTSSSHRSPWYHSYTTTTTSSSSSSSSPTQLTPQVYHHLSESTLESLLVQLEDLLETSPLASDGDWEVEYSQGVFTLKVPPVGTYVLNKQPASKQIWLSSPTSGPKRFDYSTEEGIWVCYKDGQRTVFHELLDQELSEIMGQPVKVLRDVLKGAH